MFLLAHYRKGQSSLMKSNNQILQKTTTVYAITISGQENTSLT